MSGQLKKLQRDTSRLLRNVDRHVAAHAVEQLDVAVFMPQLLSVAKRFSTTSATASRVVSGVSLAPVNVAADLYRNWVDLLQTTMTLHEAVGSQARFIESLDAGSVTSD